MNQLTIRSVPDDVLRALREEAAERGQSVNTVVREALEAHAARRRDYARLGERIAAADALRERIARRVGGKLSNSAELIRQDRERE